MPSVEERTREDTAIAKYQPPTQRRATQIMDIAFLLIAIFVALWLPLKLRLAGAAKELVKIESPTWEKLGQNPTMAATWEKLGYTPETAHDIIQNRFNYTIDWLSLTIMAAVLIAYFLFLFRLSDQEYRDVIAEKFGDKKP